MCRPSSLCTVPHQSPLFAPCLRFSSNPPPSLSPPPFPSPSYLQNLPLCPGPPLRHPGLHLHLQPHKPILLATPFIAKNTKISTPTFIPSSARCADCSVDSLKSAKLSSIKCNQKVSKHDCCWISCFVYLLLHFFAKTFLFVKQFCTFARGSKRLCGRRMKCELA